MTVQHPRCVFYKLLKNSEGDHDDSPRLLVSFNSFMADVIIILKPIH